MVVQQHNKSEKKLLIAPKILLALILRLFRFHLSRLAPSLAADLIAAAEDARGTVMSEDISFYLPDTFIRPFREEVDSRNEYKTQVSVTQEKRWK